MRRKKMTTASSKRVSWRKICGFQVFLTIFFDFFLVESGAETGQELSFLITEEPPQQESTPNNAVLEKRGRGRPPKKMRLVKPERVEREYSMAMDSSADNMEDHRTAPPLLMKFTLAVKQEKLKEDGFILNQTEPIIKRGRGRPRKSEKTFIDGSHDNSLNTSEESPYRPRKPLFLSSTADDLQNDRVAPTNISEVKTRLRGRPRTNYLHVQRMWTPKTPREIAKKQRRNRKSILSDGEPMVVVKGARGRPRIHPLPDPNRPKLGRGRPRGSYDPEHIKMLLEKKYLKEKEKTMPKFRGRPTKLESLKMMLEGRRQSVQMANGSQTSTKCTTPTELSDDESESVCIDESQLTYSLETMVEEIHGSRCGESIENKENLLFVSSKSLCDNRKLKEKILERTDPVFREMKLKFKQELKNIQKLEVKNKPQPSAAVANPLKVKRKRGPRGPYRKTLEKLKSGGHVPLIEGPPEREPLSQRLKERREAAAKKALEPVPEPPPLIQRKPMVRKKIVPTYREQPEVIPQKTLERVSATTADYAPVYPSSIDSFLKANNLTYSRQPKILNSKNPFLAGPLSKSLIVTKNPFLDNGPRKNNLMMQKPTGTKKLGRPRKYPLAQPPPAAAKKSNGSASESVFINLVSSDDEEEEEESPMNFTYPMVTNEPVCYDDEAFDITFPPEPLTDNFSISLISDDEEDGQ